MLGGGPPCVPRAARPPLATLLRTIVAPPHKHRQSQDCLPSTISLANHECNPPPPANPTPGCQLASSPSKARETAFPAAHATRHTHNLARARSITRTVADRIAVPCTARRARVCVFTHTSMPPRTQLNARAERPPGRGARLWCSSCQQQAPPGSRRRGPAHSLHHHQ